MVYTISLKPTNRSLDIASFVVQIIRRLRACRLQIRRDFLRAFKDTKEVSACQPGKLDLVPSTFIQFSNLVRETE